MRQVIIGISFFILVLGCDKSYEKECKERGSSWQWVEGLTGKCIDLTEKLQKTPQFMPKCIAEPGFIFNSDVPAVSDIQPACTSATTGNENFLGSVVCGTVPGDGDPTAYCIDDNDLRTYEDVSCPENYRPECQLRE